MSAATGAMFRAITTKIDASRFIPSSSVLAAIDPALSAIARSAITAEKPIITGKTETEQIALGTTAFLMFVCQQTTTVDAHLIPRQTKTPDSISYISYNPDRTDRGVPGLLQRFVRPFSFAENLWL